MHNYCRKTAQHTWQEKVVYIHNVPRVREMSAQRESPRDSPFEATFPPFILQI